MLLIFSLLLRLYTGPMFKLYNSVLREVDKRRGEYVTTIHALNSAILKLSKLQPACKVYRGVKVSYRLQVQQLTQIHTITNCFLPFSATWYSSAIRTNVGRYSSAAVLGA
jgi:hypothetical protein